MKIYIAGMFTNGTGDRSGRLYTELMNDHERSIVDSVKYKLESFHYVKSSNRVETMRRENARVFLDSGAFSAFTLNQTIDINQYCEYIKANPDLIEVASVLDGIGDPLKTYQNQWFMEARSLAPLPCFHFGEDEQWLEWYVENYNHITLGGMVPNTSEQNRMWLDRIWSKYLCDSSGLPKLRVHGFGMTSVPLMKRYPWYSVDSSSWVQIAFRGAIITSEFGVIHLSSNSPARKTEGQHFNTFPEIQQQAILNSIERHGFDLERLANVYISRWVFNLAIFNELNAQFETKTKTFTLEQQLLF